MVDMYHKISGNLGLKNRFRILVQLTMISNHFVVQEIFRKWVPVRTVSFYNTCTALVHYKFTVAQERLVTIAV